MTNDALRAAKLEQSCPDCGRWEAAGSYCSGCHRPMGPADWYANGDLTRRSVAREKAAEIASTQVRRPRGRPRAVGANRRPTPRSEQNEPGLRRPAQSGSPESANPLRHRG